ncbi:MAG: phosphoglycerate mutase, partial [Clostridia bacterium]|nr:phosphoglycerate mutase [Clostridia bacterium]
DNYKIMILPDHATPIALRTHTRDAVPYLIFEKNKKADNKIENFCEESAKETGNYVDRGCKIMDKFLG